MKCPLLAIHDPKKTCYLYTDASKLGLGAVLKQEQQDGKLHPIGYFSVKNTESEGKQPPIVLECRAIKEAIAFWHHYLYGKHFFVITDHKPLESLKTQAQVNTKLGEMIYYLSQYDFKVIYRKGEENAEADALSRNPVLVDFHREDCIRISNLLEREDIIQDQSIITEKDKFEQENDILFIRRKGKKKIIVSDTLSQQIIEKAHKSYGHPGIECLKKLISDKYFIKDLTKKLTTYVKSCETCITNKSRSKSNYGLLSKLGPAKRPFEIMSIDTVGGFGGSRSEKKYMHILIDHFTRYVWINTSSTQHYQNFINLINPIIKDNQIDIILADQYTGINNNKLKHFITNNKCKLIFTAVDSAHSNGLNERVNQTIVNRIRCKFNEEGEKRAWSTLATEAVDEYNRTPHSSTGFSPKFLLYGMREKMSPLEEEENISLEDARKRALVNSNLSFNTNKARYDKRRRDIEFEEGDLVYLLNGSKLNRKKLAKIYIGPYKIIKKISPLIYFVGSQKKRSENNLFHISKLIAFQPKRGDVR